MAFKLTAAERKMRAALVDKLTEGAEALREEIETFNAAQREAFAPVAEAAAAYNAILAEVEIFRESIAEPHRETWDDRSEKWQDGDAGGAAHDFVEAWENLSIETVDLDQPEDLDEPDLGDDEQLGDLPEGAGE